MNKIVDLTFSYAFQTEGKFIASESIRASDAPENEFYYQGGYYQKDLVVSAGLYIENLVEYIAGSFPTQNLTGFVLQLYNKNKQGTNQGKFMVGFGATETKYFEMSFVSFMNLGEIYERISIDVPTPPEGDVFLLKIFATLK